MEESKVSAPNKADQIIEGPARPLDGWRRLPPQILVPSQGIQNAEEVKDQVNREKG
jgi:hypothetical protein